MVSPQQFLHKDIVSVFGEKFEEFITDTISTLNIWIFRESFVIAHDISTQYLYVWGSDDGKFKQIDSLFCEEALAGDFWSIPTLELCALKKIRRILSQRAPHWGNILFAASTETIEFPRPFL